MARLLMVLLALTIERVAFAQPDVPPVVAKLIERFKSSPSTSPSAVWRYQYNGATVFYVPRLACCDIKSRLYNAQGTLMCYPDGGVAGIGDGKCRDFFSKRSNGQQLWSSGAPVQGQ